MSEQGPPPEGDPTVAVPPTDPDVGATSASVFGEPGDAAAEPTVVVPPVSGPGEGTPPPGGGGDGPDGPEGADEERPWYAHPAVLVLAGLIGVAAIALILVLVFRGDDDTRRSPTTTSTTTTSTTTTSTTVATTESRCRAGDQAACDEFSDSELQRLCDEGATAACQVLLSRQGDGIEPEPPAPEPAPSDFELCQGGDRGACSRLSTSDVSELCGMGVTVACEEADTRFGEGEYDQAVEDCRAGIDAGCQVLTNNDLAALCDEGVGAACAEIDSRTGE